MRRYLTIWMLGLACSGFSQQPPVFHTSGRFLLDPCGDTVVMRAPEVCVNHMQYLPEIAKTGANFVRLLMDIPGTSPANLDAMLALVKSSGMGVDVALGNGTHDGSAFADPNYVPVLKKYEDIITLHAQGEGQQSTAAQWLSDAKGAIDKIRGAGLRCPLFILSTSSGRDPFTVLHNGQQLADYDPQHNILCGVQLYWGYTANHVQGWWMSNYGMTDKAAIDSFAAKNFPIVAGIDNWDGYSGNEYYIDYETQMSECQAKKISWFWWDWANPYSGDVNHLTTDGTYGHWASMSGGPFSANFGEVACVTHPASIKNSSKRTAYMLSHTCNGVAARVSADPLSGPMPLAVQFDGLQSTGTGLTYAWTFGDGSTSTAQKPQHTYSAAGSYKVKLIVSGAGNQSSDSTVITVIDPSKEPTEISCGKTATASSAESGVVGAFPAANAVDCNMGTRWASNTTDNEWMYVDLGTPQTFDRVILQWETAYASSYKLQTSGDAQTWADIYSTTTGNGGADTINVNGTARYVRMLGITRATQYGYSLYEFGVYKIPSATTAWQLPGVSPAALDGRSSTRMYTLTGQIVRAERTQGGFPCGVYLVAKGNGAAPRTPSVHIFAPDEGK